MLMFIPTNNNIHLVSYLTLSYIGLRLGNVSGRKLYQYDVVEVGDEAHTEWTSYGWGVEEHKSWSSSSDDWSSSSSSSGKSGKSGSWSTGKSGKSGGLWSSEGKSGKSGAGSHYGKRKSVLSYVIVCSIRRLGDVATSFDLYLQSTYTNRSYSLLSSSS